jgi:hypothetical protein
MWPISQGRESQGKPKVRRRNEIGPPEIAVVISEKSRMQHTSPPKTVKQTLRMKQIDIDLDR